MALNIPDFAAVHVLVAGDLMLDRYWFGPTARISPEAPVPVVNVTGEQLRAGGAANVAINLGSLGVKTRLCGIVGTDDAKQQLQSLLGDAGIDPDLIEAPDAPTITKLRVLSRNQQLIRLDTEDAFDPGLSAPLEQRVVARLAEADACVLSDYAKGTLSDVGGLIAACRTKRVPVLVDPKGTDFARYRGASVVTPNLAEFQAVAGVATDDQDLVARARRVCAEHEFGALVVTLSERGMIVIEGDTDPVFLPARAREVFDVTGAGDTVIATLAAGLGAGESLANAAALANLAAGVVVRKIGVASVTPMELRMALSERGQGGRALLDREQAIVAVAEAQARGERVVMTNGCFDILHTGHVAYLEEAKALGDRLLVAVNDDDSVRRLKGDGRPVNPLPDRMAVLAGLASVDWVVPFGEDTPADLIEAVRPDALVKGGDYTPEQIAGATTVRERGGAVHVLQYREGRSTSAIIAAIKEL